jgi:nucleoside phosphorylase
MLGICGGLHPELEVGDLILATQVQVLETGLKWAGDDLLIEKALGRVSNSGARVRPVSMVSASRVVETAIEKQLLWKNQKHGAVDMEAASVAQMATENNLPWFVGKIVSDDCRHDRAEQ